MSGFSGEFDFGAAAGGVSIFFAGRLDDLDDLRRQSGADAVEDVLAALWSKWGELLPEKLEGVFALAVADAERGEVFLARDRLGQRALWYAASAGRVAFATGAADLLARPGVSAEVDPAAVAFYLTLGCVPAPLSMWKGVRKLPAGHRVVIRPGGAGEPEPYWLPPAETTATRPAEAAEQVRSALADAVRRRLPAGGGVGVPGSVDLPSAVVAALAAEAGADCLDLELPPPDPAELLEALLQGYDEPVADVSAVRACRIALAARGRAETVLTGEGAEEVFAAAWRHLAMRHAEALSPWKYFLLKAARLQYWPLVPRSLRRPLGRYAEFAGSLDEVPAMQYLHLRRLMSSEELVELMERDFAVAAAPGRPAEWFCDAYERNDYDNEPAYAQRFDLFGAGLPGPPAGADLRRPMLDERVVSLGLALPAETKIDRRGGAKVLRETFAEVFSAGAPAAAPAEPVADWLRNELADPLRESLLEGPLVESDWLSRPVMKRWIDDHAARRADHSRRLWALLILSRWLGRT